MKICFIILSLLVITSINYQNETESETNERSEIKLDFKNKVAQTTISIKKNITYYAYLKGADGGQNVEFQLTMDNTIESPFTKFIVLENIQGIDIYRVDSYDIDLSQKQKANKLVLIGNYQAHSLICVSNSFEFVSSCDIPNLQIKITITGKSNGEKFEEALLMIILIPIIIAFIIIFGIVMCCLFACGICSCAVCSKQNQQINPPFAPIQPSNQIPQQYYPPPQ